MVLFVKEPMNVYRTLAIVNKICQCNFHVMKGYKETTTIYMFWIINAYALALDVTILFQTIGT